MKLACEAFFATMMSGKAPAATSPASSATAGDTFLLWCIDDEIGRSDLAVGKVLYSSNDVDRRPATATYVPVERGHSEVCLCRERGEADPMGRKVVSQRHDRNFAQCEVSRQANFRRSGLTQKTALREKGLMPGPTSNLHVHLRAWRKHLGLTLEQVGNKVDYKSNTISGWETGDRTVDLDDLKKLADAYGVAPALLLYAPPGSPKLQALDELSDAIDGMDPEAVQDLLRMAKRLSPKV